MASSGIGKLVYGVRKLSNSTIELEGGKLLRKPSFFFGGDCRTCALLDLVCEELERPCSFILKKCGRLGEERNCEECELLEECLFEKPCCWECSNLAECLEMVRGWAIEFVKDVQGCEWEEFAVAMEILAGDQQGYK